MSRKSLFNDRLPHEGRGVQRQRPHHLQALCGCRKRFVLVAAVSVTMKPNNAKLSP
jgi:hypothetical protein